MRKQVVFILLTYVTSVNVFSQSYSGFDGGGTQSEFPQYMPTLLPASPDAYSFTKYGNLPIGINTGTAQYSLPVYTIQSGSLSHPISINYSSNGVKVDEMATRVGINWSLKAGGVITRSILGLPDGSPSIYPTFFHGPITWDTALTSSWDLYDYVREASYATPPDYQPDEYSFNVDGYSGKFLKRENGEFTQFNSSGMTIEGNGNFILTAPNGVKYYFTLSETPHNFSYPENNEYLSWAAIEGATAWYLTKIVSPTRDSIVFNYATLATAEDPITYSNGITQNYSRGTLDGFVVNPGNYSGGYLGWPGLPYIESTCVSTPTLVSLVEKTENNPPYLSSIDFAGGTVSFIYSDRLDVTGEKKLDTIKVFRSSDSTLIKCIALQYTYSYAAPGSFDTYLYPSTGINYTNSDSSLRRRLFLTAFDELSTDLVSKQRQSFEYDSINSLPPRLSFAQDRYGAFNGKVNTLFYPNDTWYNTYTNYSFTGGDRTYSFIHARKGMLKKITYPTGGYTLFDYAPNKTIEEYATYFGKDSVYSLYDTSVYVGQQIISDTIQFDSTTMRGMILSSFCEWATDPVPFSYMGVDTVLEGTYRIDYDIENVSTSTVIVSGSIEPGTVGYNSNFAYSLPTGTYRITATANRPHLRAKIMLMTFWYASDTSEYSGIAGVRVKSIVDYAAEGTESSRREFIYGDWGDSTSRSGTGLNYDPLHGNEISVTRQIGAPVHQNAQQTVFTCGYNTIHSSSVLASFLTENNTVLYKKVIELNSSVNGKNNGGTEYEFYYDQKKYPIPISFTWGQYIWDPRPLIPPGAPYMNNDFRTGMLKSSKTFSYEQKHGTRSILNESYNYYSVDTANLVIDTFLVSKLILKRESSVPTWIYNIDYYIYRYWRYYGFLKLDSTITIQKKYNPSEELKNKVIYYAYNPKNYKPTNIRYYNSLGETKMLTRKYTCDVLSFEEDYSLYNSMRNANMINNLLEEKNYISTTFSDQTQLSKKRMRYAQSNGLYLPSFAYSTVRAGTEYEEAAYEQYDSSGNLLQYTGKDGITTSILWGYNKQYPVAKVVGKAYDDVISESSINMGVVNNPSTDNALKTELNKLRNLSGSFATTYIYDPLIGVKIETDPNGKSIYYYYDEYNRLSLIRDKDSNIVKKICYNFYGQPVDCGVGTEPVWQTDSSYCESDTSGHTGNMIVVEMDMNPASSTYNQTRNITIENAGGCITCEDICTGIDKKCINDECVTGVKIAIATLSNGNGKWITTFVYYWEEDCSFSDYIVELLLEEPVIFEPECD